MDGVHFRWQTAACQKTQAAKSAGVETLTHQRRNNPKQQKKPSTRMKRKLEKLTRKKRTSFYDKSNIWLITSEEGTGFVNSRPSQHSPDCVNPTESPLKTGCEYTNVKNDEEMIPSEVLCTQRRLRCISTTDIKSDSLVREVQTRRQWVQMTRMTAPFSTCRGRPFFYISFWAWVSRELG